LNASTIKPPGIVSLEKLQFEEAVKLRSLLMLNERVSSDTFRQFTRLTVAGM